MEEKLLYQVLLTITQGERLNAVSLEYLTALRTIGIIDSDLNLTSLGKTMYFTLLNKVY